MVCFIITSILGALTPQMISNLSRTYKSEFEFYQSLWALGYLFLGVYLNRVVYQLSINKYVQLLMQNSRLSCYEKWLHTYDVSSSKQSGEERYPQGEIISRIMNDTEALRELMTSGTFGIFIDVFFVLSCLVSFITLNRVSGVFLSLFEIIASFLLIWGSQYMRQVWMEVRKSRANMSRLLSNMVGGIKETYYTRHENYASKRGEKVFKDFLNKQLTANVWDAGYYSVAESLYPILLAFLVFLFPYSKITEAAIIFAVIDLIQRSIGPIKDVAAKIANIQRAYSGLYRIDEFLNDLDEGHSSKDYKGQGIIEVLEVMVDVKNFQFPTKVESNDEIPFSLKDITFTALTGELVGIVGLSGCGKSTLLNIMAANIYPEEGGVYLKSTGLTLSFPGDTVEDIIHYREQVGIVSQDSHIFSDTVAFNIVMNRDIPESFNVFWNSVKEKIPYLKSWGINPEDKLDQRSLSLGQKQLLAAIRSCYLKKPIVLFDEISSGLDGELELALREMVLMIQSNSLTFIVAHRLETIIKADKILVLDKGRLVESGTHGFLIENSQVYQQFLNELSHSKVQ